MPELPDVETFRRHLNATALHKRIKHVWVKSTKVLSAISKRDFETAMRGRRMEATRRHGKHLLVALDDGNWITMHFGMSGGLKYFTHMADDPAHDRIRFDFENGGHLAYESVRLLGKVGLACDPDAFIAHAKLGPDALALDEDAFARFLRGRKGGIKSALMDQQAIAGIGNIYSDEILFQARLHPATAVGNLTDAQIRRLYRTLRSVLDTAIDVGAGAEIRAERLPAGFLLRQRVEGAPCPRCGGKIGRLKAAGRSAYYCPRCQPASGTR